MSPVRPAAVVVLAAGEGTRMKSATTPKVLHALAGRSLVGHVVEAARRLDPEELVVVVGHGRDRVTAHLAELDPDALPVVQEEQNGTGHAVRVAVDALADRGREPSGTVVVVCGDTPLLTTGTLAALVDTHQQEGNGVTVLSAHVPDPTGYGRIVREGDGAVGGVVEHKDADAAQRAITEINSGVYAFDGKLLRAALSGLTTDNSQGEEYLPDTLAVLRSAGHRVGAVAAADHREILGINDRVQLAEARRLFNQRVLEAWMRAGVTVVDPATTWVDVDATLEPDATLLPNTQLYGRTSIAAGAEVGPNCTLRDTVVDAGAHVFNATCEGAVVGPGASVGPYTYLRPGTVLAGNAKAGGFVEMKNAQVGEGSKVPHLSYVGDATIGVGANIGAATIFVNYDGVAKHHTVVGDHVRVGSDSMLVAPVTIGDGAYTAAGSVVTEDVPPGAMAVARGRQRNITGWVTRRRAGSPAAAAAEAARRETARPESASVRDGVGGVQETAGPTVGQVEASNKETDQ
ncbi:bifunctional UDP-N-acetylglucosamine diphosphorylase/glucosamine-1-phosphate N-acetyltransferase GlmU [Yinghuangia sp. ASG 101]|uniref:bifunctional UDP-N-acetylglucosamine diphosphorylase/glucosamine-1-phosphate N-acetyltransferase GlmU n=1 Tax=Yinghuangia sp. ASG 101 TaxID=2896848 RepID=UPI001E31FB22|nr:bifunctional UDP-N-acetylglucosamine diphosphorylase/glucosamine-1-phosphate N-acetyltransferase GlmU [Yinghuangia sp. ASG 101]UGQ14506.1 bifunctional UDP-N-acetylglucosamine diphosphorylase/glucosamine-1-phosphate N-acetyltransferase GlmU [Yinghuangia sp. ASG 101]